eukprot:CAMPEP_0116846044 /NCGR_PEP_ID=MMETSP0418-20121206/13618_1 /TAXON_ID=1158023 /ORGANISM="Astrosyne radiata, Strain 13vi08-1A" /LENGTH=81 /DNA_ID=CAMNT_0004477251 /DNA_START=297 /DNA_END=539 /DNA_ORIENTATION=-
MVAKGKMTSALDSIDGKLSSTEVKKKKPTKDWDAVMKETDEDYQKKSKESKERVSSIKAKWEANKKGAGAAAKKDEGKSWW